MGSKRQGERGELVVLSAADPLNLAGILTPGPKVAAVARHRLVLRDGIPVAVQDSKGLHWLSELSSHEQWRVQRRLDGLRNPRLRPAVG